MTDPRTHLHHRITTVITDAAERGVSFLPGHLATHILAEVDKAGVLVFVPEGGQVFGRVEIMHPPRFDDATVSIGVIGDDLPEADVTIHATTLDLAKEWWQRKAEAAGWSPPEGEL